MSAAAPMPLPDEPMSRVDMLREEVKAVLARLRVQGKQPDSRMFRLRTKLVQIATPEELEAIAAALEESGEL